MLRWAICWGIATAVCYSVYLLWIKRLRDAGCATATIASWGTTITALVIWAVRGPARTGG